MDAIRAAVGRSIHSRMRKGEKMNVKAFVSQLLIVLEEQKTWTTADLKIVLLNLLVGKR